MGSSLNQARFSQQRALQFKLPVRFSGESHHPLPLNEHKKTHPRLLVQTQDTRIMAKASLITEAFRQIIPLKESQIASKCLWQPQK